MDTEELPPKTVKAQLVRLDDNLKQIERTQFAGLQRAPGSLPVLEAFQLFLENERKIAQRRLRTVTGLALATILLALLGAAFYIRVALQDADARADELTITTAAIEQSLGSIAQRQQSADAVIAQASQTLANQQRTLAEQAQQIATQAQMTATDQQTRASEVIRLREQLETLLADQESIRRSLVAGTPHNTARAMAPAETQTRGTIGPVRRREEIEAEKMPVQYATVTLAPQGRSGPGVRWMMPTARAQE